jgi:Ca-activated chloride channel homolog
MTVSFAHPWALPLLLLVPAYLLWVGTARDALPFPRASSLREVRGTAAALGVLPVVLRALVLVALVLAIAGPRTAAALAEERRDGIPIVVAVDISSSMLAQDFAPQDRLEVAKLTTARFIAARSGDPIGLVAFAGEALTLVPVTTHRAILNSAVQSLQVGLLEDGTAIGDGLASALNRLRAIDAEHRVVVLLSDGENNRGSVEPLDAARAAAALGVQIFTVGVGSDGPASFPVERLPEGFRYTELEVGLDEDLLREIATLTGGQYFRATDTEALENVYATIDELVPTTFETEERLVIREWALLLILLAAGALLGEWSLRASRWGTIP